MKEPHPYRRFKKVLYSFLRSCQLWDSQSGPSRLNIFSSENITWCQNEASIFKPSQANKTRSHLWWAFTPWAAFILLCCKCSASWRALLNSSKNSWHFQHSSDPLSSVLFFLAHFSFCEASRTRALLWVAKIFAPTEAFVTWLPNR